MMDVWGGGGAEALGGGKLPPELEPYVRAHLPLAAGMVLAGLWAGCLPYQIELG